MATKLGGPPNPLPPHQLGFEFVSISLPLDTISGRSGSFGVPEGGVREVVGQNRSPGNPLSSPPNALVGLVPLELNSTGDEDK